jgi:hypothetical protein
VSVDWRLRSLLALVLVVGTSAPAASQDPTPKVTASWKTALRVSRTTPTLQVVVNPPLRRGSDIHDRVFDALRDLEADYVRYVPWLPYPRLGVAELEPPRDGKTSWDFSLIDPMTLDFLEATRGHPVILNFSTIPAWMFVTEEPVAYPDDPDEPTWTYTQGSELRDPSGTQVAEYYARLLSWYTRGGFTDELGHRHESGHHFSIPYWEVMNEPDLEHDPSPEAYTRLYDAIVTEMRKVQPDLKFVGMSLAFPAAAPHFFEYFLNPENHAPGIPLDFISYHFYAVPSPDETLEIWPHTFFARADGFLAVVRYVESIRERLSPTTRTTINEIGSISADDLLQFQPGHVHQPIPKAYWNLSGALYAYLFGELSRLGIDVVGESQLVGYPTQFPSVSMVDWNTGQPNARYWVLKLLLESFSPGDRLVETRVGPGGLSGNPDLYAWGAVDGDGQRRLLLVNKRDRDLEVSLPGAAGGTVKRVDQTTAFQPPASAPMKADTLNLGGFAVAVVTFP